MRCEGAQLFWLGTFIGEEMKNRKTTLIIILALVLVILVLLEGSTHFVIGLSMTFCTIIIIITFNVRICQRLPWLKAQSQKIRT